MQDALAPYTFHGIDFRDTRGKERVASCPFGCADDEKTGQGHFFVSTTNGKFNCKKCSREGNAYSFLKHLHAFYLKKTKKDHYVELGDNRKLPWQAFKDRGLAYDPGADRWLLGLNNAKGALANLLTFTWKAKEPKLLGTSGCAQHLFLADEIKQSGPIYICEGQWDAIALLWLFDKCGIDPASYSVVAVPGATTFKSEWVELFKGREVVLLFDNDTTGATGMDKIQKMLEKSADSIKRILWPADFPLKYDIRDFVSERLDAPKQALQKLFALIPKEVRASTSLVRTTFKSVLKDFRKVIHVSKTFEDALAVVMAVTLSSNTHKDPLWLFLVGPPGAGKTLLIHSFLGCPEKTHFLSSLTKTQLISGFAGGGDGEDPSILPKLRDKCLFVEDYTTIKSMPLASQEELYGLLRSVFNGKYDVQFGNFTPRSYENLFFSMVAGVTDAIHGDNRATLGERFLKFDIVGDDCNEELHLRSALNDVIGVARDDKKLRDSVASFLYRDFNPKKLPPIPAWFHNRIVALAALGARMRATVAREGKELLYRPRPEFGTRLIKQLAKLGRFLAYVLGKSKVDDEVYALVQRVALDTVVGFNVEILNALNTHTEGLTIPDLVGILQLSDTTIDRRLQDLQELRIIWRSPEIRKTLAGRPKYVWHLTPVVRDFWHRAEIRYTPPKLGFTHKGRSRPATAKKKKPTKVTRSPRPKKPVRKAKTR